MFNIFNTSYSRGMLCGLLIKNNIWLKLFKYFENSSVFYNSYKKQPFAFFKHDLMEFKWDQEDDWACAKWFTEKVIGTIGFIPTLDAKDYFFVSEEEMYKFIDNIRQEHSYIKIINMTNKVTYSCRINIRESTDCLK